MRCSQIAWAGSVLATAAACNNSQVPDTQATFGTGGSSSDGSSPDESGAGTESDTMPDPQCWPEEELINPVLWQCEGVGEGVFTFLACDSLQGCSSPSEETVELSIDFPTEDPDAPNVRACCIENALPNALASACIDDCARAACSLALENLEDQLAAGAPTGCVLGCETRFTSSLTAWIDFLRANFDDCLTAAVEPDLTLIFPNADVEQALGAAFDAVLDIDCTNTVVLASTQEACEEPENPLPVPPEAQEWGCSVFGFAQAGSGSQTDSTPIHGSVRYQRGECVGDPCWFQVDEFDLYADDFSSGLYGMDAAVAHLAYPAFGSYKEGDDSEGSVGPRMLGLNVSLKATTSGGPPVPYAFSLKNSSSVDLTIKEGSFKMEGADFAWPTGEWLALTVYTSSCQFLGYTVPD